MDTETPPREPSGPATGTSLVGLTRAELAALVAGMDEPAFRARQLWQQIYNRGARDFAEMTDLSKAFRHRLEARFTLDRPLPVEDELSADGARKWLLRFADGNEAETVYIPEEDRGALCISSQVGCTLNCRFCHTGTQRMVRNLEVREIVGQLMVARDALGEWPSPTGDRRISNIVMMGMGEPLYNFENVRDALHVVMDGDGISISKRRITLSTAGVVPMMRRCGEEIDANLAVSLHAVTDEVRDEIVPLNRKYPLAELMRACREYPGAKNARRITFEYVMLHGVNDTAADARELVRLLEGIPSKVNLIPFNPWPGAPFERSRPEAIRRFTEIVNAAGRTATVRTPRGEDIMAACGQLKSASEKLPARLRATATAGA